MSRFSIKNSQQSVHTQTSRTRRRASLSLAPNWGEIELEKKALLATITFKLTPADYNWNNAANWDLGRVPTTSDDAVIPDLVGNQTILVNSTATVLSLNSAEPVTLSGGNLNVTAGTSKITGLLTINSGRNLTATGLKTRLISTDTSNLDTSAIIANNGANITLSNIASINKSSILANQDGNRSGASIINIYSTGVITSNSTFYVCNNGAINANLSTVADSTFIVDNVGSISMPILSAATNTTFKANQSPNQSGLSTITMNALANITGTSSFTAWNGGKIQADSITEINGQSIIIQGANATMSFAGLQSINRGYVDVSYGATLNLPSLTSANSTPFYANYDPNRSGASLITMNALANVTGTTSFTVWNGGKIEANSLTQLAAHSIVIYGPNSTMSLSSLQSMDGSYVDVSNSANLILPALLNANNTRFYAILHAA